MTKLEKNISEITFVVLMLIVAVVQALAVSVGGISPLTVMTTPHLLVFYVPGMLGAFFYLVISKLYRCGKRFITIGIPFDHMIR